MSGLYVHLPFCKSKCPYCDFYSAPRLSAIDDFITAVLTESRLRKSEIPLPVATVYLGGGTPSLLSPAQLTRLVEGIYEVVDSNGVEEFTIEANPDDITADWASMVRRLGFNRVSVGIQSFVDTELRAINRRHDAAKAIKAIEILRDAGITEISADLIYGLPLQTLSSWRHSLDILLNIQLPHFSAYSLTYEPGTRLYAMRSIGKITATDDDVIAEMNAILVNSASDSGYEHYEISNFCIRGHQALHNSSYWNLTPYLGLGPSAHSFDGETRRFNPANLNDYIASLNNGFCTTVIEEETPVQRINDYIITALRTSAGVDTSLMSAHFPQPLVDQFMAKAHRAVGNGSLRGVESGGFTIPEPLLMVSDAIMMDLLVD